MSSRATFLLIAAATSWILAFNSGKELRFNIDVPFNIAYLLTGVLVLSYLWARYSTRSVDFIRTTRSRRSQVGQFAEEQFEITNRGRFIKLWLEIEDFSTLPWHGEASRVISSLGRKRTFRWQVKTLCTRRGYYRLGPMKLRSGDPLGIFSSEVDLSQTAFIVVYPQTIDLPSFDPSISSLVGGEARHRRTFEVTTNAAGVRDYLPGDSLNRIHWPTSVRIGRLMTKEFDLDPTADIWIYLDLHRGTDFSAPWTPTPPQVGLFALSKQSRRRDQLELPPITTEYAVTAAASLARYFLLRNRAVGMSSWGRTREYLQADRGERQLNKILEALAVVEAAGTYPFSHLVATEGSRLNRHDTVLAISADPSPDWAQALQLIRRRGVNSIAVTVDGSTFDGAANYHPLMAKLEESGMPTFRLERGVAIEESLMRTAKYDRARGSL